MCHKSLLAVCAVIAAATFAGCMSYEGAKVVEGTDLSIGMNVPSTEGALQITALNYLSGFRFGAQKNSNMECTYTITEKNSYCGIVTTDVVKSIKACTTRPKCTCDADYAQECGCVK